MNARNSLSFLHSLAPTAPTEVLKVKDIVRLANGQQLIVTEVKFNRPANPYLGVLVRGTGKQYKFGPKHHPTKIGVAPDDHPALVAKAGRSAPGVSSDYKRLVGELISAVESGDNVKAKILAAAVRVLG